MFARILNAEIKLEKKEELVKIMKNQVLPILKKQTGFHEILAFFPEKMKDEKSCVITLWATKTDVDRYERETYPKVQEMVAPFLRGTIEVNKFELETTVSEHFVEMLVA